MPFLKEFPFSININPISTFSQFAVSLLLLYKKSKRLRSSLDVCWSCGRSYRCRREDLPTLPPGPSPLAMGRSCFGTFLAFSHSEFAFFPHSELSFFAFYSPPIGHFSHSPPLHLGEEMGRRCFWTCRFFPPVPWDVFVHGSKYKRGRFLKNLAETQLGLRPRTRNM
jgi:hypothetical protein